MAQQNAALSQGTGMTDPVVADYENGCERTSLDNLPDFLEVS
jgi:hypothetical protein